MKKLILIFTLMQISGITSAQDFLSNKLSFFTAAQDRIDFYDGDSNLLVSLAPNFYRQRDLKKWIKPIKVEGDSYFIKIEKRGVQAVYTSQGKHVANMSRDGIRIEMVQEGEAYTLRPRVKIINPHILECQNINGELVSSVSSNSDRKLTYELTDKDDPNILLMALCVHQYQEMVIKERARLMSTNQLLTSDF